MPPTKRVRARAAGATDWRRTFSGLGLILLTALAAEAEAQDPPGRSFSVDSRYVLQPHSTEALGRFGLDVTNLTTLAADWIGPGSTRREIVRGLTVLLASFYLGEAFSLTYHELGHGSRNAAVGLGSLYGFGTLREASDEDDARRRGGLSSNIFAYYVRSIFAGSGGFTLSTTDDVPFPTLSDERRTELAWSGLQRAGGMNHEMFYAELIEDLAYQRGAHVGFFTPYLKGKLSASELSSSALAFGDINRVVTFYQQRGLAIDKGEIHRMSRAATLLSAMSYQVTYEVVRMLLGGSYQFRPWTLYGIQPPNTSFFMNRQGLSLKFRSGVNWGDWRFPVAYERVVEGETRSEITLGAEIIRGPTELRTVAGLGRGLDLTLEGAHALSAHLQLSAGYSLLDERNLQGARLIPSLEHGFRYHGLHLRVAILY